MSRNGFVQIAPKQTFRRKWLPWLIIGIPAVYIVGVWAWPSETLVESSRRFGTNVALITGLLLFWAWGVWVSSYRRWFLVVGCAVAGILAVTVERLECDGDMRIIARPRFGEKPDDRLQAHRRDQAVGEIATAWQTASNSEFDFPEYRGRRRDGVVNGPKLNRDWSAHPPRCIWRQPVGGGYAQFAVAGNAAVTIEQRGNDEAVVCYDTESGVEHWKHAYPARFNEMMGGEGPRATPTIADGHVYSLGATGVLCCLELQSGRELWRANILAEKNNVRWGMSGSPLVVENMVVVNPGSDTVAAGPAVFGYERTSGKLVMTGGDTPAGYSSPMLATLAGRPQILLLDARRIAGYDKDNGKLLWSYPWETQFGINVAQPLVLDGDRIFITAGYGMGCVMLRIVDADGQLTVNDVWPRQSTMRCKFTSPVYHRGFVYGLDEGVLACIDAATGQRRWRDGRYGHGQLLLSEDLLVILSETGQLVLVEATPEQHLEIARMPAIKGAKTWNPPALANGKIYVRNADEMACYDLTAPAP